MTRFSVLDLSPITEGGSARQALANTLDLARHVEALGFARFWVAEHHNMQGIASAATAVVIGHIAQGTQRIRVGAGGVMLPNHSPLVIAEQFGTLEALFPGRIDLGIGRAPGTDQVTAHALRRTLAGNIDDFPRDVVELQHYLGDPQPGQRVHAVPGEGSKVPIWILGSSLYGAQLAAMLGLPYAFASHFAPGAMMEAIDIYRTRFAPSAQLAQPHVMLGFNVCAADDDAEAQYLRTSSLQSLLKLRLGNPGRLPPPRRDFEASLNETERQVLAEFRSASAVGSPETVRAGLAAFIERTAADELMIVTSVYDHGARKRSFEIVSEVARTL
jgi:luciferase family oxidoreductase group 1